MMQAQFPLPPLDAVDVEPLPPGTVVGSFVLQALRDRDEFCLRYRATASASPSEVTIEEFAPSGLVERRPDGSLQPGSASAAGLYGEGLQAFVHESERLRGAGHPSLQGVGPLWRARGTAYRLREPVPGRTLAEARAAMSRAPSEAWLRELLAELLDALQRLHDAGGLHGNVQPQAIVLQADGRPVLVDPAGVRLAIGARLPLPPAWPEPRCVAPEWTSPSPGLAAGPWSDLYALAAVLRWCSAGAGAGAALSAGFAAALDRASARDPRQRPQSAAEFRRELDALPRTPPPPVKPGSGLAPLVPWPEGAPNPSLAALAADWPRSARGDPGIAPAPAAPSSGLSPMTLAAQRGDGPWRPTQRQRRWPAVLAGAVGGTLFGVVLTLGIVHLWQPLDRAPAALAAWWTGAGPTGASTRPSRAPGFDEPVPSGLPPATPVSRAVSAVAAADAALAAASAVLAEQAALVAAGPAIAAPADPAAAPPTPTAAPPVSIASTPAPEPAPDAAPSVLPAAAPRSAAAAPRVAASSPVRTTRTAPLTPAEACAPRSNFSLYRCMTNLCAESRYYAHPQCIRLRVDDASP